MEEKRTFQSRGNIYCSSQVQMSASGQVQMSALALPTSSFCLPFQGLETANAAKHESDIRNA